MVRPVWAPVAYIRRLCCGAVLRVFCSCAVGSRSDNIRSQYPVVLQSPATRLTRELNGSIAGRSLQEAGADIAGSGSCPADCFRLFSNCLACASHKAADVFWTRFRIWPRFPAKCPCLCYTIHVPRFQSTPHSCCRPTAALPSQSRKIRSKTVKVAAIDATTEHGQLMVERYGIESYPSLVLFTAPPRMEPDNVAVPCPAGSPRAASSPSLARSCCCVSKAPQCARPRLLPPHCEIDHFP